MNRLSRRRLIGTTGVGLFAALAPLIRSTQASAQERRLVITTYGGRYQRFWREVLLPPFQRQTGIETVVDVGLGFSWATTLRATGPERPAFSYVMMNELVGAMLREEGFFAAWPGDKVPNLQHVHRRARGAGDLGITAMVSPIGIAYRSDLVRTPPRSWKDLWDNPELRGKIGLYQIQNTAAFMFLMTVSMIYGSGPMDFDAGFRMIERLKPFPQGDLAGSLAILLTRGEIVACPLDVGETLSLRQRGAPVAFAAPSEGMFMFDQTFNLLKHAPNRDAACAFLDYMLSEDVQVKLAEEFAAIPVNTRVRLPAELAREFPRGVDELERILTFDWIAANRARDAVTERWNRTMR